MKTKPPARRKLRRALAASLLALSLLGGYVLLHARGSDSAEEMVQLAPGALAKWEDPNYSIITVGSYNYTDYDIYGVYLLPPNKNSLEFAASGDGARATRRDQKSWQGGNGGRASLAWDYRWETPRKFKVWWQRVVNKELASAAASGYDEYTHKETQPGMAWCEGEIVIATPPHANESSGIVLHFFPNGDVEGAMYYRIASQRVPQKVELSKRYSQPKLADRPCLKEIPNPFYGRKKPSSWNLN